MTTATLSFEQAYARALDLHRQGRLAEADALYRRVLALNPVCVEALNNRGAIRQLAGDWDGALASYDRAVALRPDFVEALNNRGNTLLQLRRPDDALASFDRALALAPGRPAAMNGRAGALLKLKRFNAALAAYQALRAADPANPYALGGAMVAAQNLCDWDTAEALAPAIAAGLEQGAVIPPFPFLGFSGDSRLQLLAARNALADLNLPVAPAPPPWSGHDRIRLAYISSDFCQHPVPMLIARLIELHDRARFTVTGISTGGNDHSPVRARIEKAFDSFHDMRGRDAAALVRELEIDILVDLNGHTEGDNFAVLAQRPAPLQVGYLGYPATSGADTLDYILADATVAPAGPQAYFSEQIVQLPGCYFPTSYGPIPPAPSRPQAGLPENAFVFASFNNAWKITRPMFSAWMRLLSGVEGSVLWLLEANSDFRGRLRRAAQAHGIAPHRMIFANRTDPDANLARQQLADLVLDTSPYNGHMTSSDALWAGIPLVTLRGAAFAGRVAASLLQAVDLSGLITDSLTDYETLASALAHDPVRLAELRARLAHNKREAALFDIARLTRQVENAFTAMHAARVRRESPRGFAVAP